MIIGTGAVGKRFIGLAGNKIIDFELLSLLSKISKTLAFVRGLISIANKWNKTNSTLT